MFSIKPVVLATTSLMLGLAACADHYASLEGRDVREVVRILDDEEHMVVWPRDETTIFSDCEQIDYVTLVPRDPPSYAINVRTDRACTVVRIERSARTGL